MKTKYIILIILLIVTIGSIAYYFYNSGNNLKKENSNTVSKYNTTKVGSNESIANETLPEKDQSNTKKILTENLTYNITNENGNLPVENTNTSDNNLATPIDSSQNTNSDIPSPPKETEIASFSTKIYTKDSQRQNNVSITCNTLNNTIVENGKTFSFCNTVGKATTSKGYQKADVFKDGEKIKALGGGNCQVSTTLYNAVLKIPELKVTERHSHSNSVPYIQEGKDAAVAYGSYDFKFVNNTRIFYKNK